MKKSQCCAYWICMPLLLICLCTSPGFANSTSPADGHFPVVFDTTITGTILNDKDEPLANATVTVKNTGASTTTNDKGVFTLSVPGNNAVLVISYVGYQTQEINLGNRKAIEVSLKPEGRAMDDVVVVGYGIRKKSDVTGALSSVSAKQIEQVPTTNITQALQGRVPGLMVNTTNFRPGETPAIRIRGNRTLVVGGGSSGLDEPVYVVDGVITPFSMSDFNPLDIESIEVLKDASATAIYGARGANGVILITTKRGKGGKMVIELNSSVSFDSPLRKLDPMDGGQFAQFRRNANNIKYPSPAEDRKIFTDYYVQQSLWNGYQWRDRANLIPAMRATDAQEKALYGVDSIPVYDPSKVSTYNWDDEALRTGITQNYQLRIAGGTDKLRASFSGGYFKQAGIQYGQDYTRYSGSATADFKPNNYFSAGAVVNATWGIQNFGPDMYGGTIGQIPLAVPYDTLGQFITYPGGDQGIANPLNDKNTIFDERRINRTFGSFYAELQPLKGLRFRVNFGPDFSTVRRGTFAGSISSSRQGGAPSASYGQTNYYNWILENLVFYDKKVNDNHSFGVTLLQSFQKNRTEATNISATDLPYESQRWYALQSTNTPLSTTYSTSFSQTQLLSYMGRLNYTLFNKYLLTFSGRWDGASQLAKGNKWQFFPSAAIAWKMEEESFISNITFINQLKLRLGYGAVGQPNIGPYQTPGPLAQRPYVWDETPAYGYSPGLPTPDLAYPKTETINAGIDFALLNHRISGSVDVYQSDTKNNILARALPGASGFTGINYNVGLVRNSGIEVSLSTVNVNSAERGGFRWTTDFVFARNKEQILDVDGTRKDNVGNRWFIGQPLTVFYNYQFQGIYQQTKGDSALIAAYKAKNATSPVAPGVVKVRDTNGDSALSAADFVILGSPTPKWTGSINNTFSYKGFDLSIFIYISQGAMLNSTRTRPNMSGRYPIQDINYWTPTNASNEYPKAQTGSDIPFYGEALQFKDASFVRVRSINLQYNFPRTSISKWANNLSVYVNAVNPFLFSNYKQLDPEVTNAGTTSSVGTAVFLSSKSFVLGFRLGL